MIFLARKVFFYKKRLSDGGGVADGVMRICCGCYWLVLVEYKILKTLIWEACQPFLGKRQPYTGK